MSFFKDIGEIKYEGVKSKNPLAFKQYNADEIIGDKTMKEHLRFGCAYWHSWRGTGRDIFGEGTIKRDWDDESGSVENAIRIAKVNFEFCQKLGIPYYCFHDRDVAPEGKNIKETNEKLDLVVKELKKLQDKTGVKLLWCTCNLFSNKRFMNGAATNPNVNVFSYAAAQVKKCLEVAKFLGAENFVFWGGREGYTTLLNTNLKKELDHFAAFLKLAVDYKKKIGGQFLIEPKPNQYDFDASTVIGFLKTYYLDKDFKLNIECNHATLAARTFHHECLISSSYGFLGSIDANQGDVQCGWDTDNFSSDVATTTKIMKVVLDQNGIKPGGLNFDSKLRRESVDVEDLFIAHILGMDSWADGIIEKMIKKRYETFESEIGKKIEEGKTSLEELEEYIIKNESKVKLESGKQEKFQSIFNTYVYK